MLVVEDEALIRLDLVAELEAHGFAVLEASEVHAALALFRSCPDLHAAVVDIGLNGEAAGYDLVHAMREERPDCAVIIASGDRLKMPDDFDEHVLVEAKPYDAAKIAVILESVGRGR